MKYRPQVCFLCTDFSESSIIYAKARKFVSGDPKVVVCSVELTAFGAPGSLMHVSAADLKRVLVESLDESAYLSTPVIVAYIAAHCSTWDLRVRYVLPDTAAAALKSSQECGENSSESVFERKIKCARPCGDEFVVIPLCSYPTKDSKGHWHLLVCDSKNSVMTVLDSARRGATITCDERVFLAWLGRHWTLRHSGDQQDDDVNCGVYLLSNFEKYFKKAVWDKSSFFQGRFYPSTYPTTRVLMSADIRAFRRKIACTLVRFAGRLAWFCNDCTMIANPFLLSNYSR
jgi:hypothetical protein